LAGVAGAVVVVAPGPGFVVLVPVADGEPLRVLNMMTTMTPKMMIVISVASIATPS
jgi:hypothetical protein